MKVLTNLDSTGSEEPTNTLPTSARHLVEMMNCAGLHGNMQKSGIKNPDDNTTVLGGGTIIMGLVGLVSGATLPL